MFEHRFGTILVRREWIPESRDIDVAGMEVDRIILMRGDTRIASFALADNGELFTLFKVNARFRRKGIGSRMLNLALTLAKMKGYGGLTLYVRKDNPVAQRMYQRVGFRQEREIEMRQHRHKITFLQYFARFEQ